MQILNAEEYLPQNLNSTRTSEKSVFGLCRKTILCAVHQKNKCLCRPSENKKHKENLSTITGYILDIPLKGWRQQNKGSHGPIHKLY
jgi:hypothetical protein